MGRYPAEPLEDKLAWMRAKQERQRAREARPGPAAVPAPLRAAAPLPPQMLRLNQVAQLLGVSRQTVKRWFYSRAVIVRGPQRVTMLIPQKALDDWIREHTNSR